MENRQAIISFTQSEKVKSGLIWCSQCIQILQHISAPEQQGALRLVQALVTMLGNEVHLARQASGDDIWVEVDRFLNSARVMIDSGVPHEAEFHFTHALSQVNRIGQKSMTRLIEQKLL